MFKSILLTFSCLLLFTACTSNNYNLHKNKVDFETDKTYTFSKCTSFTNKNSIDSPIYGKLFIEVLDMGMDCKWNGFERGYFTSLFKSELKLKSMTKVEEVNFTNYEITTYKIDDDFYVNFILYFLRNESQIIVDYDGVLSTEIIRNFDKTYENKYINEKRFKSSFDSSLVEKNYINNYFYEEREILNRD